MHAIQNGNAALLTKVSGIGRKTAERIIVELREKVGDVSDEGVNGAEGEVIDALKPVPEYQAAIKQKSGPTIFVGKSENAAGRIVVTEITGGTEGAVGIYERMSHAGIGTIVGMHMSEERKGEAQKNHINVVIAGHMSSDSLGMNLFLDELEKKGIEIIPCSGLIRVSRNKKRARVLSKAKPAPRKKPARKK